jgi:hypothetical protein
MTEKPFQSAPKRFAKVRGSASAHPKGPVKRMHTALRPHGAFLPRTSCGPYSRSGKSWTEGTSRIGRARCDGHLARPDLQPVEKHMAKAKPNNSAAAFLSLEAKFKAAAKVEAGTAKVEEQIRDFFILLN